MPSLQLSQPLSWLYTLWVYLSSSKLISEEEREFFQKKKATSTDSHRLGPQSWANEETRFLLFSRFLFSFQSNRLKDKLALMAIFLSLNSWHPLSQVINQRNVPVALFNFSPWEDRNLEFVPTLSLFCWSWEDVSNPHSSGSRFHCSNSEDRKTKTSREFTKMSTDSSYLL